MLGPIGTAYAIIPGRPPLTASTADKRGPAVARNAPAQPFMAKLRASPYLSAAADTEAGPVTALETRA